MKHINEETESVHYVVKIKGVVVLSPTTRALAEQYKMNMPDESKPLAEVVPVTGNGSQILFE